MCGARIQAVMTRGMDGGLMRLRIHSSSGERLGGKRSEMKMTLVKTCALCSIKRRHGAVWLRGSKRFNRMNVYRVMPAHGRLSFPVP